MTEQQWPQELPQEVIFRWPNGRIRRVKRTIDSVRRQRRWYADRQPWYEESKDHGKEHGQQQGWYESGQPSYDCNYEHGRRHGREQGWYPDGQPAYDYNYEHGRPHGSMRKWKAKGRLVVDVWYEYGALWDRAAARPEVAMQGEGVLIAVLLNIVASYL
jgi:hypothetical protein